MLSPAHIHSSSRARRRQRNRIMLNTAIVGLGWWGKTLVKAARDFGAPLRFTRGITLEPDTVRDFATEHQIAIGTAFEDVLADKSIQAVVLATWRFSTVGFLWYNVIGCTVVFALAPLLQLFVRGRIQSRSVDPRP